jgi:hypothetical protein
MGSSYSRKRALQERAHEEAAELRDLIHKLWDSQAGATATTAMEISNLRE